MTQQYDNRTPVRVIRDQQVISTAAMDIIKAVNRRRKVPLQPRDRMALKLLTPKNSALVVKQGERNLGCRQISFDLLTEDLGRGSHRLRPAGIHLLKPGAGWFSDQYGRGRFLWNLYLDETPDAGLERILERLFDFKLKGVFGRRARLTVTPDRRAIAGRIDRGLNLYIQRESAAVETSLRRISRAGALHSPREVGLRLKENGDGRLVLIFGKRKRLGVSFTVEKL